MTTPQTEATASSPDVPEMHRRAVEHLGTLVEQVDAVQQPGAMERIVHLSFGDFAGREYTMQLFADMLIHGWDLARAIGADERLDEDLVDALAVWFSGVVAMYRVGGAVAASPHVRDDADARTRLLAQFGRSA
jgi:uncharacterized protein (TIGR03086 family)